MTQPALHFVSCADAQGGHRMAYWQWGDPLSANVVVCVHGLTRQGRDFDLLAQSLVDSAQGDLRVVCPDIVGRGQSDWLADPVGYQVPLYAADVLSLLNQLHAESAMAQLDYVGTSMGGLIGLVLAGYKEMPLPSPVRRLVLNDVGPTLDPAAVQRIGNYVGQAGHFASVRAAADAMWAISTGFGPHTPAEWLALSEPMVVAASERSADGARKATIPTEAPPQPSFLLHYDPAIGVPLRAITPEAAAQGEAIMWSLYDAITADTLLVRGASSDLLSSRTAQAMGERGPKARLIEFEGVGHAPTFVPAAQRAVVTSFLLD